MVNTQDSLSYGYQPQRISTATFSAEEINATFNVILQNLDYSAMLEALGIGKYNIFRRRRALKELQALSISLWRLALQRSFPTDGKLFFDHYLNTEQLASPSTKERTLFAQKITTYNELMQDRGETDFTPVAKYLADIFTDNEDASRTFTLKLSLLLRNVYTIIFDNLV